MRRVKEGIQDSVARIEVGHYVIDDLRISLTSVRDGASICLASLSLDSTGGMTAATQPATAIQGL